MKLPSVPDDTVAERKTRMKIEVSKEHVKELDNGMYEISINEENAGWISREYLLDIIFQDIKDKLDDKGYKKEAIEDWEIDEMALDVYDMVRYQYAEDRGEIYTNTAIDRYFEERNR